MARTESIEKYPRRRRRSTREMGVAGLSLEGFEAMNDAESQTLAEREHMRSRIIDQDAAVNAIFDALDAWDARTDDDKGPLASFAFLGPTGVGKTETAKVLANIMSEIDGKMIRIDCSDYSHGHEVAKLTGSPPGFVGREQKPILNKKDVEQFGTVVLFDEIEKGSPQLYNLMLQILGDGQLRLNNSDRVSFRNTIVILTSNLGAREMASQLSGKQLGFGTAQPVHERRVLEKTATDQFDKFFSPEFVNRLTAKIVFHPLSQEGLGRVLDTKLESYNQQYETKFGIRVSLSSAARTHIVGLAASEPAMGARPIVRHMKKLLQTPLGRQLGSGAVIPGTEIRVFMRNEHPDLVTVPGDSELVFTSRHNELLRAKMKAASPANLPAIVIENGVTDPNEAS